MVFQIASEGDVETPRLTYTLRPDRPFAPVVRKLYGYHQVKFLTPFENACWAILTQRNPVPAAKEIKRALSGIASRLIFLTPATAKTLARAAARLPGGLGERIGSTAQTLALSLELVAGRPNETALPLAY